MYGATSTRDLREMIALRQPAVARIRTDIEYNVSIGRISAALVEKRLDHPDHFDNVFRGTRLNVRRLYTQGRHVTVIRFDETC
ncbi:MAG TPA: hypothetical protein VF389_03625, partial [Woeseiaceae bacterium]